MPQQAHSCGGSCLASASAGTSPLAPGCLCFELLSGQLYSSHTKFCSPQLASKCPAIFKSLPGSHSWVVGSLQVTMEQCWCPCATVKGRWVLASSYLTCPLGSALQGHCRRGRIILPPLFLNWLTVLQTFLVICRCWTPLLSFLEVLWAKQINTVFEAV